MGVSTITIDSKSKQKAPFSIFDMVRAGHSRLLKNIEDHASPEGCGLLHVWMRDDDRVEGLPEGFTLIAQTDSAPIAGIADESRNFYGI